mmetsp:Transcript_115084/g.200290  ORF Transcript_115084/g.200290 Transcript_115084/m.200290 type:complete len:341 (-) Transcript_115084:537-1559(-)
MNPLLLPLPLCRDRRRHSLRLGQGRRWAHGRTGNRGGGSGRQRPCCENLQHVLGIGNIRMANIHQHWVVLGGPDCLIQFCHLLQGSPMVIWGVHRMHGNVLVTQGLDLGGRRCQWGIAGVQGHKLCLAHRQHGFGKPWLCEERVESQLLRLAGHRGVGKSKQEASHCPWQQAEQPHQRQHHPVGRGERQERGNEPLRRVEVVAGQEREEQVDVDSGSAEHRIPEALQHDPRPNGVPHKAKLAALLLHELAQLQALELCLTMDAEHATRGGCLPEVAIAQGNGRESKPLLQPTAHGLVVLALARVARDDNGHCLTGPHRPIHWQLMNLAIQFHGLQPAGHR